MKIMHFRMAVKCVEEELVEVIYFRGNKKSSVIVKPSQVQDIKSVAYINVVDILPAPSDAKRDYILR